MGARCWPLFSIICSISFNALALRQIKTPSPRVEAAYFTTIGVPSCWAMKCVSTLSRRLIVVGIDNPAADRICADRNLQRDCAMPDDEFTTRAPALRDGSKPRTRGATFRHPSAPKQSSVELPELRSEKARFHGC